MLPFAVAYEPYTASHVVAQLQLLVFSALAFAVLMRTGIYPPELRSVNLDFDWLYRRAALRAVRRTTAFASACIHQLGAMVSHAATWVLAQGERRASTGQFMSDGGSTRGMALWVMVMLVSYLVMYYI
jgi:multicomponent Na+:H+ antiporter subunit D